jgi:7-cyano-7-deazaguanine reductase
MEPLGNSVIDVIEELEKRAANDLSNLLKTDVRVHLFLSQNAPYGQDSFPDYSDYKTLEDIVDVQGLTITDYNENPKLLQIEKTLKSSKTVSYHSALLKSNCKVTSQPDWGDVYIYIKSENVVSKESLLKYIISFRDECHFHEEICETMYKRLWDTLKPKELMVTCLYVRRGGIDINPTRASDVTLLDTGLIDETEVFAKTQRQ